MAQWSRGDRTLYAKLVYYGPALGGKTTNLVSLHRITDPQGTRKLLSLNTASDRTLFFDLLPFDLGTILGYRVALKLYTVPGQVRYEATRRVVLAGADAVVFVADSSRARRDDNRASLESLRANMRTNRLDPGRVPVIFQCNKQDLEDAASPQEVACWLGPEAEHAIAAVAVRDQGVLETFVAAVHAMLERLWALADARTRRAGALEALHARIEQVFAPHRERLGALRASPAAPAPPAASRQAMVFEGDDTLQQSLAAGVRLGSELAQVQEQARRLQREARALRRIHEALVRVGASFEREAVEQGALEALGSTVGAACGSLLCLLPEKPARFERGWRCHDDPLRARPEGLALLQRVAAGRRSAIVEDLAQALGEPVPPSGLRALLAVPVPAATGHWLLAYAPAPDGQFAEEDRAFAEVVAGQLAVGLEKVRLYEALARQRDALEQAVQQRTAQLRRAYAEQRELERIKDRFLANLSHEMRTPLTSITGAATYLQDYEAAPEQRQEMVAVILSAAQALERRLADLLRASTLGGEVSPTPAPCRLREVIEEACGLVGEGGISVSLFDPQALVTWDRSLIARALANLLDNARKFSPPNEPIEVRVVPAKLSGPGEVVPAVAISVLDRGPGVRPEDRERIFLPFEQGGDPLTGKPPGVGLGLHEARILARAHGGVLRYQERAGGGSEFQMLLPRTASCPSPEQAAAIAAHSAPAGA